MRLIATAAALAIGCGSAPENPTWTADVKPILVANCIKCHGKVRRGGAPLDFRLDSYFGGTSDDGQPIYGAALVALFVHERTHAETMPPVAPLSGVQIETLANWSENNAEFGEPLASNSAPELALIRPLEASLDAEGFLVIEVELHDPDFEVVSGSLKAVPAGGGDEIAIPGELYSGRTAVRFDAAAAPEGGYELVAALNDGNEFVPMEVALATYDVVHPDNTAPAVVIASPSGPDQLFPLDGINTVLFTADDADGDTVDAVITAERGGESIEIATVADVELGVEQSVAFDPPASAAGGNWRIRVEVSDGQLSRSDTVGPLVFTSGPGSSVTFSDIQGILSAHCSGCHVSDSGAGEEVFADQTSFEYADPESVRQLFGGEVYRRVVLDRTMPARSTEILNGRDLMPEADRELVADWILGGAPP